MKTKGIQKTQGIRKALNGSKRLQFNIYTFDNFLWLTVAFGTVEMYKNLLRRIVTAQIDEAVYRGAECWQRRQTRYSHLLVSVRGRHLLTFAGCRFDSSTNLQRARGSLTS